MFASAEAHRPPPDGAAFPKAIAGVSLVPWDVPTRGCPRFCSGSPWASGPPLGFLCSSPCEAEFNYRG